MLTVIDNEYGTLFVYPEDGIVHHSFRKPVEGNHFRQFLEEGSKQFFKYNCNKWLSDDRNNRLVSLSDTEWARTEWQPIVTRGGWQFWGVVSPKRKIGKLNMNRHIERQASLGVNVRLFETPESALHWLKKEPCLNLKPIHPQSDDLGQVQQ